MGARSERYTIVAIVLHWVMALAIIAMILGGWYMGDLPDGAPGQYFLYQMHKSVGITILLLTVARILWRVMNPPPALPDDMKGVEKTASRAVHIGFYGLMLLLPLTGWLYSSVSQKMDVPTVLYGVLSWPDVPFVSGLQNEAGANAVNFVHSKLAWVALALLALHVAGAIKHELSAEEGVLKRMIPGLFGQTRPPALPGNGAVAAFGSAIGILVLVTATPMLVNAMSGNNTPIEGQSGIAANWQVDDDQSEIRFGGVHDGTNYTGTFGNWDAAINFEPATPQTAQVSVTVATTSARASDKVYTDSLPATEWLNTGAFPTAQVDIINIQRAENRGYTSTARLTLKGITVEVPFQFSLDIDGNTASMTGQATLMRTSLDLGQESDPSADWVGEDVTVDVKVVATRLD